MFTDLITSLITTFFLGIFALGSLFVGIFSDSPEPTQNVPEEPRAFEERPRVSETTILSTEDTGDAAASESVSTFLPPMLPFHIISTGARKATVQILCITTTKTATKKTTQASAGSGIIIDRRGVVLTNAHVAQFFLLEGKHPQGEVDCSIRSGDPIENHYEGKLLYLPPTWIERHAKDIDKDNARGTGEHDYALLLITGTKNSNGVLPITFPFVGFATTEEDIMLGNSVALSGYPTTEVVETIEALDLLRVFSTIVTIKERFTFEEETLDLISLGGTPLSYQGSSGGAVMDGHNKLVALITSSTEGDTAAERDLRAITLAHIERSLLMHTGFGFDFFLLGDLAIKAAFYESAVAPELTERLIRALKN